MNKLCTAHLILSLLFLILKLNPMYVDWTGEYYDKIICLIPIPCSKSSLKSTVGRLWRRDFFAGAKLSHADLESGASHIR